MIETVRKTRVTRDEWLMLALEVLAEEGINAVTVQSLARRLGVTRGGFYYHFKDRRDLTQALLDFWAQEWTYRIIEDAEALGFKGREGILAISQLVRHRQAAKYDAPVRSWALHDPEARAQVKQVDEARLSYLRKRFSELGFEGPECESRVRLILYYMMAEPTFYQPLDDETAAAIPEIQLELLTRS